MYTPLSLVSFVHCKETNKHTHFQHLPIKNYFTALEVHLQNCSVQDLRKVFVFGPVPQNLLLLKPYCSRQTSKIYLHPKNAQKYTSSDLFLLGLLHKNNMLYIYS